MKNQMTAHLKYKGNSDYAHKEVVFCNSREDIDFVRLSSIELIEYLYFGQ